MCVPLLSWTPGTKAAWSTLFPRMYTCMSGHLTKTIPDQVFMAITADLPHPLYIHSHKG